MESTLIILQHNCESVCFYFTVFYLYPKLYLFANYLFCKCVTQRFEIFKGKALYTYLSLLLLII